MNEGNVTIGLINSGAKDNSESTLDESGENEMVGRSPALLAMRETFFRVCEFSRNYALTKDEAITLFREAMHSSHGIMSSESGNTTVKIGETLAVEEVSKLLDTLPALGGTSQTQDSNETKKAYDSIYDFCTDYPNAAGCDTY